MGDNGKMTRFLALTLAALSLSAQSPLKLQVDATDAPRRILHTKLTIPATGGPLRLAYPKWIPGEHAPTGPVTDLVNLRISSAGKTLTWKRDPVEMYTIIVDVPAGATSIELSYDFITPPETGGFSSGSSTTTELALLSWNQVILYPEGKKTDDVKIEASLRVPAGWKYGTALPIARESGDNIEFKPVSATTMVDSPVIAGRHLRTFDLSPGSNPPHYLHVSADSREAAALPDSLIASYRKLVKETGVLFGARHYGSYHFLLTLSDHVAHFGLEHHESSDNRLPENSQIDPDGLRVSAGLLPHEMSHSWNGKYRRPTGLATSDYQQPMQGELLWVYEGLTNYLGDILTPRSGLITPADYRQRLAMTAADLDASAGRQWRPLADTAVAAQLLYSARGDQANLRRGVDFYPEGSLIWLEADVRIRQMSGGKKSLDDFCKAFHGGRSNGVEMKTYTLDDIVATLNQTQAYDWRKFIEDRIYKTAPKAPMGGIELSGWKLAFKEELPELQRVMEDVRKTVDVQYSLGLELKDDGVIKDVISGSPAGQAGVSASAKLIAVNGRQFTAKVLRAAIKAAKTSGEPIELLVKDGEYYRTHRANCTTGERYPALVRDEGKPDLLTSIIASKS